MNKLGRIIKKSSNIVFFGGAGVSTESGIPDFRSGDGVQAAMRDYGVKLEELLSRTYFLRNPEIFYKAFRESLISRGAKPNAAHYALARLEDAGRLSAVVTQNIDGLHQGAGSRVVYELHGSVTRYYCMDCAHRYDLDFVLRADGTPRCLACGGIVRPDVVLYEEELDGSVLEGAINAIAAADTLIVGGTSLVVYPAAGMLSHFRGDSMVIINRSETPYDGAANLVIRDSIGDVLSRAVSGAGF